MKAVMVRYIIFFAGIVIAAAAVDAAEKMNVQVKESFIRSEPSFMGKILAKVSYGDQVDVLEENAGWKKVRCIKGDVGWIHQSALSVKQFNLQPGSSDVKQTASSSEIALAGKGFNKQVESQFKARNKSIDYKWIDKMETFTIKQSDINKFLIEGGLGREGGTK